MKKGVLQMALCRWFVVAAVGIVTSGHIVRADPVTPYYGICVNLELMDIANIKRKCACSKPEECCWPAISPPPWPL